MAITKSERRSSHKKQERLQIKSGSPAAGELTEGVPALRFTTLDGLVEYINFKGILYKKVYTRV